MPAVIRLLTRADGIETNWEVEAAHSGPVTLQIYLLDLFESWLREDTLKWLDTLTYEKCPSLCNRIESPTSWGFPFYPHGSDSEC